MVKWGNKSQTSSFPQPQLPGDFPLGKMGWLIETTWIKFSFTVHVAWPGSKTSAFPCLFWEEIFTTSLPY